MKAAALACALVAAAATAVVRADDEVTVVSPQASAVSVTIYRDDLALITETRIVDLPAGPVTVVLQGVVDTLLPQSAVLDGAGRSLAESDFRFDQLTPASLLTRSIGKTVVVTRTNPKTGVVARVPATVLSAGEGVVLELEGGNEALYCSGLPERLEFQQVPDGLLAKPQLSVRLAGGEPGERTLEVSYLAHGFGWSADYVARLNESSDRLDLEGWVTLVNRTATGFVQAQVQVVAGRLNVIAEADGGSGSDRDPDAQGSDDEDDAEQAAVDTLRHCYPLGRARIPSLSPGLLARLERRAAAQVFNSSTAIEEITVTGSRIVNREALGDYQLYRLPWLSDLGARQTKQVAFLSKRAVHVERFYGYRLDSYEATPDEQVLSPRVIVSFENTERAGLGEPLPKGRVRMFEPYAQHEVFAGEDDIDDKPVGLAVELTIGRALNLTLEATTEEEDEGARTRVIAEHRVVNAKDAPVVMEIRHAVESDWKSLKVRKASLRTTRKHGDLAWRFTVPAGGVQVLRYELSAIAPYE